MVQKIPQGRNAAVVVHVGQTARIIRFRSIIKVDLLMLEL